MVGLPPYAMSTMPYPLLRQAQVSPPPLEEGTRDYHKVEIEDAQQQFEVKETTVSHALRVPHPALGGRTYGAALAQGLIDREVLPAAPEERFRLVEVGGGTGIFAKAFVDGIALRAPRLFNRLRYTILDLSPALRASQRERTQVHSDKIRLLGGDAERLPFADASVDCVVSNEVIADLPVAPVRRVDLSGESGEDGGPGAEAVRRYGLRYDHAPGLFFVNLGAFRFLEEIARVLKPGGTAYVSEYGTTTGFPQQSTHLDHAEFSIQFRHLERVASQLGLEASLEQLAPVIGLEETVRVLETTQSFFVTLRAFLASKGVELEKIAYTQEMFTELLGDRVRLRDLTGVRFTDCGKRLLGLKPPEFKALLIRKPRSGGRAVKKVKLDL
jgi:ubiquinone/menaquinone biosynthesis C-methylase UbiE